MSKQIDTSKIERIQEAAIVCISRNGVANASVSEIAREAGVSVGYLYRHYTSKEELLNDLLERALDRISDKIEALLEQKDSIDDIIHGFVEYLFQTAQNSPDKIRFIMNLQNDFSCDIAKRIIDRLKLLCEDVLIRGHSTGIIGDDILAEDMYVILLCVPLQYVGIRFRGVFSGFESSERSINRVTQKCLAAIK